MSSVVPAASSHFPTKVSPKKGFKGFFSFPYLSLRLAYEDLRVVRNHLRTNNARFCGSFSLAGATRMSGCSAQYAENSTRDVDERMKGGAVSEERSPENDAIDCGYPASVIVFSERTRPLNLVDAHTTGNAQGT